MRYVIIGNSAAGNAAAEAIRRHDQAGKVTIFSDEPAASYYRPLLPLFIEGDLQNGNLYRDPLHIASDVVVRCRTPVHAILPADKQVLLGSGEKISYDKLLLATGASAVRHSILGSEAERVFVLRTLQDAQSLKEACATSKRAVIVGGGRIGTKTALALRHLGIEVTIVEMMRWMIPLQLDKQSALIIQEALQSRGIEMLFGRKVVHIGTWNRKVTCVCLDDGAKLSADLVILATGIKPNTELAEDAGISTRRGILVNSHLQTSEAEIFAAGDVVETRDVVTGERIVSGIWTNAVAMGHVAGENMAGGISEYQGAFSLLNALDIAGIPVISAGVIHAMPGSEYEVHTSRKFNTYRKLVFRNGTLAGLLLVGAVQKAGVYTTLIREHTNVSEFKQAMLNDSFGYSQYLQRSIAQAV